MSFFLKHEYDYRPGVVYKGGGGSTGQVDFPDYMEDVHKDWLGHVLGSPTTIGTDLIAVMDAALISNPLAGLTYDPYTTEIAEVKSEYGLYNASVDALGAENDWDSIVDNAVAKVDQAGVLQEVDIDTLIANVKINTSAVLEDVVKASLETLDDNVLLDAVEQFIRTRQRDRARLRTRYKAAMSNLGAERSSAYALGLALLEIDFERETGEFQQRLELQTYQQGLQVYVQMFVHEISSRIRLELINKESRDRMLLQGVQQTLQYKQFVFQLKQGLVQLLQEIHRISFVMDQEYISSTAELDWKHDSWDFEVYNNGIAVLGGIGGGQFVPNSPSKAASTLGGALQGAGTGAAVGTAIAPGVGTAIGAGVGAIAGGLAGLF